MTDLLPACSPPCIAVAASGFGSPPAADADAACAARQLPDCTPPTAAAPAGGCAATPPSAAGGSSKRVRRTC